jgi:hypothetical protein
MKRNIYFISALLMTAKTESLKQFCQGDIFAKPEVGK